MGLTRDGLAAMSAAQQQAGDGPTRWGLAQAAAMLREGRIDSEAYVAALLERCAAQAHLNAFATLDQQALLAGARAADVARQQGQHLGPLHGLPIALKDNIGTARWPTGAGTAALREWRPAADATVTQRLMHAGALLGAKTTMHELAMGWTGQNAAFGDTRNPHDPSRMAGGSSGGSACAVAAHLMPGAIGTDTNGSIRVPSAFCGNVGLRPTQGRYPMAGVVPLAPSLDTLGPMARSVEDVALLDAVMAGVAPQPLAPRAPASLRVGICGPWFWERLDDDVAQAAAEALSQLERAGVQCVHFELPELPALVDEAAAAVIGYEVAPALATYLQGHAGAPSLARVFGAVGGDLSAAVDTGGAGRDAAAYDAAMARREQLRRLWAVCFRQHRLDALIHPAVRVTAPPLCTQRVSPGPDVWTRWGAMPARNAFAQNVTPASLAGAPSLVLPARAVAGRLPVGLQLDGLPGNDRVLLSVAAALEQVWRIAAA
jgi:mandelamide amidase